MPDASHDDAPIAPLAWNPLPVASASDDGRAAHRAPLSGSPSHAHVVGRATGTGGPVSLTATPPSCAPARGRSVPSPVPSHGDVRRPTVSVDMHSEPAATPWAVDRAPDAALATTPSSASTSVTPSAAPAVAACRHLTLLAGGAEPAVGRPTAPRPPAAFPAADIAVPPMAESPTAIAAALFATPAALLDLLAAAAEHRRALDLVRTASEIGAIRIPPALAEALDRARASWPASLPFS